jgi:hypothetical protein
MRCHYLSRQARDRPAGLKALRCSSFAYALHAAVRYSARCWEAVPALDGAQPVEDNVRAAGAGVTRGELPHTERWDMVR